MEEEDSESCVLPKRYCIVGLLFLIVSHDFSSRTTLSAVVKMFTEEKVTNSSSSQNVICKHLKQGKVERDVYQDIRGTDYGWTTYTRLETIKYFYIGYLTAHPFSGYISDKYGSKYMVVLGILCTSVLCLSMTTVVDIFNGAIMIVRLVTLAQGIFSGILQPAVGATLAHWVPSGERALLSYIVFMGVNVGLIVQNVLTAKMIKSQKNWGAPLFLYGGVGLGISLVWFLVGASNPEICKGITSKEQNYLRTTFRDTVDHGRKEIPMRHILLSRAVWCVIVASMGYLFLFSFASFFLKNYIEEVLLDFDHGAMWSALPYVLMSVMAIANAAFSDWLINTERVSKVAVRKTFTNVGMMGASIYMVGGSYANCADSLVKTMFMIAMALESCSFVSIRVVIFDLSPNYAGMLTALSNGIGTAPAIFIPDMVHAIAPNRTLLEYRKVFFVTLAVSTAANLFFVIFGSTTLKTWNAPPPKIRKRET